MDSPLLQSIDASVLEPVVRLALGRPDARVQSWQASPLSGGFGNPVSLGLLRIQGTALEGEAQVPWSLVLKALQSPGNLGLTDSGEGDDPTHWNYWRRELLIYQSGLLEDLPQGVCAPRCSGAVELTGSTAWLWLEDIHGEEAGEWDLERFALAARHLGRLNGALDYSKALPAFPWLSRYPTRQWYAAGEPSLLPDWQHPRLLRQYPQPEHNPFRTLLLEQERVFDCLTRLPAAFCHGDFYPTNLISRTAPGGEAETVVLDWGMAGISCLGDDLGQLCMGACVNLTNASQAEVIDTLFDSYMSGLRDAGCRANPSLVRLGFSAMAAFRIGAVSLWMIDEELKQGWNEEPEQADAAPEADCYEVALARSAVALLDELSLL